MHNPRHPQAFRSNNRLTTFDPPEQRPARVVEVARPPYQPEHHTPAPPPMPTLTITPRGTLHLHATLRQALGLQHGQSIDLVPPPWNSVYWHLDLRPCALRRVVWHDNTRVRAEGIRLPPGLVTGPLVLHLLPGTPAYANYYPLLPANAFLAQAPPA